jgi:2-dehydro-3-deoxyphosphogalactonate aldolase
MTLDDALAVCPAVAIIRGVKPDEALAVVQALYDGGLRAVEVPLNSPDPFESIRRIAEAFGGRMAVGAGTVLHPGQAGQVKDAGGVLIVSPNTNPAVIARAVALGLVPIPGFATATEAFAALDAGARHLKLFPASTYGPGHVRQIRAVLPPDAVMWAVGGVGVPDMAEWWKAGVRAFGLGSELYKPGMPNDEVGLRARAVVKAIAALS